MKIKRLVTTTMLTLSFATLTTIGIEAVQGDTQIKVQAATLTYSDEQLNGMSDSELATALGYTSITRITYDASDPDKEYKIEGTEYTFKVVKEEDTYLTCISGGNNLGILSFTPFEESLPVKVTNGLEQTQFNTLILADLGKGFPSNATLPTGPNFNEPTQVIDPTVPNEDDYLDPDTVTEPTPDILVDNTDPNAQPITTVDPSTSVESTIDSSSDASSQDTSVVLADLESKKAEEKLTSSTSEESNESKAATTAEGTFEQTGLSIGLKSALLGIPIALGGFFWLTKKEPESVNDVATIEVEPDSENEEPLVKESDELVEKNIDSINEEKDVTN